MKTESKDRRTIRTEKMIRVALSQLIEEKGFNDLSITDITTRADINRGTFYLHYTDKYDLLEKIENELIEELLSNCNITSDVDKQMSFMIKLFQYLNENAIFMKAILGPKGDPTFQCKLKALIQTCLFENNKAKVLKNENMLVPESYFIAYVLSAHLGVIQHWLESDMERSPEDMASILSNMFVLGPFKSAGFKMK